MEWDVKLVLAQKNSHPVHGSNSLWHDETENLHCCDGNSATRDLVIHMVKMHTNLFCDGGHGPQRAGHAQTTQPTHKTRASGVDAEDFVRHVEGRGCWVRVCVGVCGGRARRTANDSEREACSS